MKGRIITRGSGNYAIVLSLDKDETTGKYKQKWITVKGNKKDAERKLAELTLQYDAGMSLIPGKVTVAQFLDRWLKDYAVPNLAPRTVEGYQTIIRRHLIPGIGKIALSQLKPEHIQHYISEKLATGRCDGRGGLNSRTVRHHHMCLHDGLQMAVKWGLLSRNPADAVTPPRPKPIEMQTWNEQEVRQFIAAARVTPYYALFSLALSTGMRRSELLGLQWEDIDLPMCQVYVNRSLHCLLGSRVITRQPKTAQGRRVVALPPTTSLMLQAHRETQEAIAETLGVTLKDSDFVFCDADRKPLLPDTVSHVWAKLVRRTGLKRIRLHDARHTHASLLLKAGIHPKIVSERLGHAGIGITLDLYSHVAPGMQEAAAKKFDALIAEESGL